MPVTPATAAVAAVGGGHAFISRAHPQQLTIAIDYAQSFAVDNGAFSAWKSESPITDWNPFYLWIGELHRYPNFDFAVIPDVIDGDEAANDALLEEWPWRIKAPHVGAPVWHLHESLERLQRLARAWPRICFGSSGEYKQIGTPKWWGRMVEAMNIVCDKQGLPICKLHGLRMLDPKIFTCFPFASADSTNIARNIGIDSAWKGTYTPPTKEARAAVMRARLECHQALTFWDRSLRHVQPSLFDAPAQSLLLEV